MVIPSPKMLRVMKYQRKKQNALNSLLHLVNAKSPWNCIVKYSQSVKQYCNIQHVSTHTSIHDAESVSYSVLKESNTESWMCTTPDVMWMFVPKTNLAIFTSRMQEQSTLKYYIYDIHHDYTWYLAMCVSHLVCELESIDIPMTFENIDPRYFIMTDFLDSFVILNVPFMSTTPCSLTYVEECGKGTPKQSILLFITLLRSLLLIYTTLPPHYLSLL